MSNKICVWILACGLVGFVGCSDKFKIVPVSGQVTAADGKPLDKIFVEFYPSGEGPKSYGETDANGKFTLKTNDGKDGAMIGKHRVSLKDTAVLGDKFMGRAGEHVDMTEGRKPRIANKYTSIETSELTFEVTAAGESPKFQPAAK